MKRVLTTGFLAFGLFIACALPLLADAQSPAQTSADSDLTPGWVQIYAHDENGTALGGDRAELIDAIREGAEVRVYWRSSRVEHLADAHFLTVIDDHVFAQPDQIRAQRPDNEGETPTLTLAENGQGWTTIISTTGAFPYQVKWFVRR